MNSSTSSLVNFLIVSRPLPAALAALPLPLATPPFLVDDFSQSPSWLNDITSPLSFFLIVSTASFIAFSFASFSASALFCAGDLVSVVRLILSNLALITSCAVASLIFDCAL